jgi:hypothetical protein
VADLDLTRLAAEAAGPIIHLGQWSPEVTAALVKGAITHDGTVVQPGAPGGWVAGVSRPVLDALALAANWHARAGLVVSEGASAEEVEAWRWHLVEGGQVVELGPDQAVSD